MERYDYTDAGYEEALAFLVEGLMLPEEEAESMEPEELIGLANSYWKRISQGLFWVETNALPA